MSLRVEPLSGAALDAALPELASLRITVFRDFPYLYDGDAAYEARYMQSYRDNPRAILVAARDGDRIVGAATGMPLADHSDAAQVDGSLDIAEVFYCAESVLLLDYRGQGIGHAFFDQREAYGRRLGLSKVAFCAVQRAEDHPLRPDGYTQLDPFWRKRGYAPVQGLTVQFSWKDIDTADETAKTLQFWMRDL